MPLARALGSTTRAQIYEHLKASDHDLTVKDVAESFDLHPNVARTHLSVLADAGLLVVGRRKHPGGDGRRGSTARVTRSRPRWGNSMLRASRRAAPRPPSSCACW